jgi:hypothetical protein
MFTLSFFRKACGNKIFIASFDHFSHFNRLSRYIWTPIIITIIIFPAPTILIVSIKDEFSRASLGNAHQKLFDHGHSIAFISLNSLPLLKSLRTIPERSAPFPGNRRTRNQNQTHRHHADSVKNLFISHPLLVPE